MKFVKVNEIPNVKSRSNMKTFLTEFMHMNVKMVRVDDHGYKSAKVAANCLGVACRRHVLPIDVRLSNGEVYLVRRDM